MTLKGRRIVVGGGTGDVGVGIVAALVDAGTHVIVPARDAGKAAALRDGVADPSAVTVLGGAPTDEAGAALLRDRLGDLGPIDGAIASLGSWFSFGRLVDTPAEGFETAWRSLLLSHMLFAKAVIPVLPSGGRYVVINGAGSEAPVPQSSAVSIHAHAVSMVFETLKAEHPDLALHMLMLRSIIATRARPNPDPTWVTAEEVGRMCAWLFTPEGALTAGSVAGLHQKPA